ncbi:MAG: STAS domain-containing protein [Spirochaetes bacterium]|nr:STAS domain-containing protein [Spirochaetota bacterium]
MIFKRIKKFHVSFNIYVDLSEIKYMDSTFLGLMVGIEKKLFCHLHTHLFILNPNDISKKIIRNIGLNRFLKSLREKIPNDMIFSEFDEEINIEEIEKTKIVLNSHKNLMEISEQNRQRFQSLTDPLEKQINQKK